MPQKITLADLGWNDDFARDFAPYAEHGWKPARLLRDNKISYGALLIDDDDFDELDVILGGK
ncbi:MAG: ribosome small subunit-dependent GTPase A, partial [Verrucomicrobia bacterium]|nr:ribosome small subunit-dependent GTPase A [Verrucomicrobiota bacterium]